MNKQRGGALLLIVGAIVATVLAGGLAAGTWAVANNWCNNACEDEKQSLEKVKAELAKTVKERDGWIDVVAVQNAATKAKEDDAKRRIALKDAALKASAETDKNKDAAITELMATKPTNPNDPCLSACTLLRSPL